MGPLARDRRPATSCGSSGGPLARGRRPAPFVVPQLCRRYSCRVRRCSCPLGRCSCRVRRCRPISTVQLLSAPIQLPTGAMQPPISPVQLPSGAGSCMNIRRKAVWPSCRMASWHGPSICVSSIRSVAPICPHSGGLLTVLLPGGRWAPHGGAGTWQKGGMQPRARGVGSTYVLRPSTRARDRPGKRCAQGLPAVGLSTRAGDRPGKRPAAGLGGADYGCRLSTQYSA